jgi:O-antigen/teichoic acid export membrane protein
MMVLSALARFRGAEAVGEFGLALALTTPAFTFVSMGGKSSQASDVMHRYSFAEYAGLVVSAALIAAVASISAGLFFAQTNGTMLIIAVVASTKVVESISTLSYGAFQQAGRVDKVALSLIFRGAFTVALFVLFLWLGFSTAFAFFAQLMVWSTMAFLRDYPLASHLAAGRFVWPSTNWRRLLRLLKETSPLGAGFLVSSLIGSLPRLFVQRSLGVSAVGLLTVVNYFQQGGQMLFTAMSQAIVNRFARLRRGNSQQALRRTLKALVIFVTVCSAAGLLATDVAGKWFLVHVFGRQFGAASDLLMLIAVALCVSLYGVIPQSLIHADRRFTTFLLREIIAVLVCVAFLAVFVPHWGLIGAGYAILATGIVRLLIMCIATFGWQGQPRVSEPIVTADEPQAAS